MLVLACAYVFTPFIVAAHALSIPNAFVPGTLIGGEQTAAWLWVVWHAVFPPFIGGYAFMAGTDARQESLPGARIRRTGTIAIIGATALAFAVVAVVTLGDAFMPRLMRGDAQSSQVSTLVLAGDVGYCMSLRSSRSFGTPGFGASSTHGSR